MRVVVDSNVLFSFFNADSAVRDILLQPVLVPATPELTQMELARHEDTIRDVARISADEFQWLWEILFEAVEPVPVDRYEHAVDDAFTVTPDRKDVAYFALAQAWNAVIWSNEQELAEQDAVNVLDTAEMLALMDTITA